MTNKRYTAEQKRWAVQQMAAPNNRTVVELARETGITTVSLRTWREDAVARGHLTGGEGKATDKWSSAAKFRAVLQTAAMSEAEISAYCRERGIQPQQLVQWRLLCEQANAAVASDGRVGAGLGTPVDNPTALHRIKELERDLRRKEAALAVAAALLILRKKANAIWGRDEEE